MRGGGCDQTLAERLDVPRAWVSAVREAFFGDADACEARTDGLAQLADLAARTQAVEDRAMALAADAEALKRDVAKARKAAGV